MITVYPPSQSTQDFSTATQPSTLKRGQNVPRDTMQHGTTCFHLQQARRRRTIICRQFTMEHRADEECQIGASPRGKAVTDLALLCNTCLAGKCQNGDDARKYHHTGPCIVHPPQGQLQKRWRRLCILTPRRFIGNQWKSMEIMGTSSIFEKS